MPQAQIVPATGLVDVADGFAHIQRCLDSREWWLFLGASPQGCDLITAVEKAHYATDDRSPSFHLVLLRQSFGLVALALARKAFMLPPELAAVAGDVGSIDGSRDVVITPDAPAEAVRWLGREFHYA